MSNTTLRHQIIYYFICGAISTSCDFILYYTMYTLKLQIEVAKGLSFLIASLISYFLNKHLTFKIQQRSVKEFISFILVHIGAMLIDVSTNRLFILALGMVITGHLKIIAAFILATGCSVVANFLGQKFWVFQAK